MKDDNIYEKRMVGNDGTCCLFVMIELENKGQEIDVELVISN